MRIDGEGSKNVFFLMLISFVQSRRKLKYQLNCTHFQYFDKNRNYVVK
jgi:hypothetical protein